MIRALAQTEFAESAVDIFRELHLRHLRPDTYSYPFVLKAAAHLSANDLGKEIHGQIVRTGHCSDVHVSTALIHLYSLFALNDARLMFEEMSLRDIIAWNAIIGGYSKQGDMGSAQDLFEQMPARNVVSWTTIISGYVQIGSPTKAMEIFHRMQIDDDVQPDEIALLAALSACAQLGALRTGEWIHQYIQRRRLEKPIPLMNSLIDMYAKSGSIVKALEVFEGMARRTVITWTTLISGMALHGLAVEALQIFRRMEEEHISPNDVTFVAVLSACSHAGLVSMGRTLFHRMRCRYNIRPRIEHFGCMVDLLSRAGLVREAKQLVEEMPFEANGAIWGSLLAAARSIGDSEIGELAMGRLLELEPHNSANYSMLSDIYASQGKWRDVGRMRMMIRDYGLKKMPGGSSVEVGGEVHEFTAGDSSHPQLGRILETLLCMNGHLKMVEAK